MISLWWALAGGAGFGAVCGLAGYLLGHRAATIDFTLRLLGATRDV